MSTKMETKNRILSKRNIIMIFFLLFVFIILIFQNSVSFAMLDKPSPFPSRKAGTSGIGHGSCNGFTYTGGMISGIDWNGSSWHRIVTASHSPTTAEAAKLELNSSLKAGNGIPTDGNWSGATVYDGQDGAYNVGCWTTYFYIFDSTKNDSYCNYFSFYIDPKPLNAPNLASNEVVYDGYPHTCYIYNQPSSSTVKWSSDNVNWSDSYPTRTDVGTTNIYAYYISTDPNYTTSPTSSTYVKITPAATSVTLSDYRDYYDGNPHSCPVSGGGGGTLCYRYNEGAGWSVWITGTPTRTIAGTTSVEAYIAGDSNHSDSSVSSAVIDILKAPLTPPDISDVSATYDGNSHAINLVSAGSNGSGGTLHYSYNEGAGWSSWVTWTPGRTLAGTTSVRAIILGDGNHENSAEDSATITINPRYLTAPTITGYDVTYDANYHQVSVSDTETYGTLQYKIGSGSWTNGNPTEPSKNIDVMSNTVYVRRAGDGSNTITSSENSASIIIRTKGLRVWADNKSKVYGTSNPTFTVGGVEAGVGGQVSKVTGTPSCSATQWSDTGDYPITQGTVQLTNNGTFTASNYHIIWRNGYYPDNGENGKLTITKAPNPVGTDPNALTTATRYACTTYNLTGLVLKSVGTLSFSLKSGGRNTTTASSISGSTFTAGKLSSTNDNDQVVDITVTAAGNNNYYEGSANTTITVQKWVNGLTWTSTTPSTVTYLDTSKSATVSKGTNGLSWSGVENGAVTYSSSNTGYITINSSSGALTVVCGNGSSVITASMARTTTVKPASTTKTISTARATGYITLSATERRLRYMTPSITFNVNTSHHSGHSQSVISATDDNAYASVNVAQSGQTAVVTVSGMGVLEQVPVDTVITITVKAAQTCDYNEATATYTITIIDDVAPTGQIDFKNPYVLNNGNRAVNNKNVTMLVKGADVGTWVISYRLINEGSLGANRDATIANATKYDVTPVKSLNTERAWTLSNNDGMKTVYMVVEDTKHNLTVVPIR